MKHSEYIELTSLLKGFSDNSGTLRLVFSKVEAPADPDTLEPGRPATKPVPSDQAKQHPGYRFRYRMLDNEEMAIRETLELMDGTVDTWTDENQARADKGLGPTADVRELYSAMSDFLVATETPIDGAGVLYDRIRQKCIVWMDQAVTWFPALTDTDQTRGKADQREKKEQEVEQFKVDLQSNPKYLEAIEKKMIIRPFIWTQSKRDLVDWLQNNIIPTTTDTNGYRHPRWSVADNVFIKDGKPISGKVLNDTAQHMKGLRE